MSAGPIAPCRACKGSGMILENRQCSLCKGVGMLRLKPSKEKELSDLRESVRRLVGTLEDIGSQEPSEDHNGNLNDMIACQSVEKATAALTAFLAENREFES